MFLISLVSQRFQGLVVNPQKNWIQDFKQDIKSYESWVRSANRSVGEIPGSSGRRRTDVERTWWLLLRRAQFRGLLRRNSLNTWIQECCWWFTVAFSCLPPDKTLSIEVCCLPPTSAKFSSAKDIIMHVSRSQDIALGEEAGALWSKFHLHGKFNETATVLTF